MSIVIGPGSLFTSLLPACWCRASGRRSWRRRPCAIYVCNVATQVGETSGFDLAGPRRGARAPYAAPGIVDVVLANNDFDGPAAGRAGAPSRSACAGRRRPERLPRLVLDDVVDPDNAHHHDPARLAAAIIRLVERESRRRDAGPRATGALTEPRRPSVPASRAVDGPRARPRGCAARRAGRDRPGAAVRPAARRPPGLGQRIRAAASAPGRRPARGHRLGDAPVALAAAFAWARARPLPDRLAAGHVPGRGSLSLAGGPNPPRVRRSDPDDAPELAARLADVDLPAAWRIAAGRGVVTWKSAETVGTFLRRIGAGAALLELEARQVSRALRGELNRVLNAESANLGRSVAAAGRQLAAIEQLEVDGRLAEQPFVVRSVAEARRETPEATLGELAERLGLHRSAVQRALERIEWLALHDDPAERPVRRDRTDRRRRASRRSPGGRPASAAAALS